MNGEVVTIFHFEFQARTSPLLALARIGLKTDAELHPDAEPRLVLRRVAFDEDEHGRRSLSVVLWERI